MNSKAHDQREHKRGYVMNKVLFAFVNKIIEILMSHDHDRPYSIVKVYVEKRKGFHNPSSYRKPIQVFPYTHLCKSVCIQAFYIR